MYIIYMYFIYINDDTSAICLLTQQLTLRQSSRIAFSERGWIYGAKFYTFE